MNVKGTKKADKRVDIGYLSRLGIQSYGHNNLYPQELRAIIEASPNGATCVERRATYIEGNGLASQAMADSVCDLLGSTFDDVHHLISEDLAYYDGFALHINYNVMGEVVSMSHIPFENCRLAEPDEEGFVHKVVIHPDWSGKRTRNGKAVKVSEENCDYIDVYNPDKAVVQQQIMKAGGIAFYKGQILYRTRAGKDTYCTPVADTVLPSMSGDEAISNVSCRNVRNNFLPAGILVTKKGQSSEDVDNGFSNEIVKLQGDMNAVKILHIEIESDEDMPEFKSFDGKNYDKEFTASSAKFIDDIYARFNQEQFARLRRGSIGFSGELANDVKREYAEQVTKQQRMITRAYRAVVEHWAEGVLPYQGVQDIMIEPLIKAIDNGTN